MRKRILAVIIVLALVIAMAPAALAADGQIATITAYTSAGAEVGTYTTIDAAVNAAGENGRVVISEGTLAVSGRQTISKAGVTVEGAGRDKTYLVTSESFQNGSETNRKALLTIAADGVTVKGMTIDGSIYGNTITAATDFVVIRVNDGDGIELNDVYVTGSPKTLVQLGMSTTTVSVSGTDFYCKGMPKSVTEAGIYADVDINSGSSLNVNSGSVDGFVATDDGGSLVMCEGSEPLYTLTHTYLIFLELKLTSTFQHFAETYVALRNDLGDIVDDYVEDLTSNDNQQVVANMVTYAASVADEYPDAVADLIVLLTDAQEYATGDDVTTLQGFVATLTAALES